MFQKILIRYRNYISFFLSLILSCIIINKFGKVVIKSGNYDFYIGNYLSNEIKISVTELYKYILMVRGRQFIVMLMFLFFIPNSMISYVISIACGIFFGIYFSMQTMYAGFQGIIMSVVSLLPHGILYGTMIFLLVFIISDKKNENRKLKTKDYIFLCFLICMLYLVGVYLECYVSYDWMKIFL